MIFRQLEVVVLDVKGRPLKNAEVTVSSADAPAVFDEHRRLYTFDGLDPGEAQVTVRHRGFTDQQRSVQVHPKPTQVVFMLVSVKHRYIFKGCNYVPFEPDPGDDLGLIPYPTATQTDMNQLIHQYDLEPDLESDTEVPVRLMESGYLDYAEPQLAETPGVDGPNALLWPLLWDRELVGVETAWKRLVEARGKDKEGGDAGVTLAVVDTGIFTVDRKATHPDFANNKIKWLYDFDAEETGNDRTSSIHGIQCAGVANGKLVGVAPGCSLMSLIYPNGDQASMQAMYRRAAINWEADVFSTSNGLGCGLLLSPVSQDLLDFLTRRGRQGKGCLQFFSAGNEEEDIVTGRPFGWYERAFSCAASTIAANGRNEVRASYSGRGAVDWCAPSSRRSPGDDIANFSVVSAYPKGRGRLPSRPTIVTSLTEKAEKGSATLTVSTIEGLVMGAYLLVELPDSPRLEVVRIDRFKPGRNQVLLFAALRHDHVEETPVISGTEQITRLWDAFDSVGFWPWDGDPPAKPKALLQDVPNRRRSVVVSRSHHDDRFGGTSSATALSAGIGALVLSANPDLTWVEAREILRKTAKKIDPGNPEWLDEDGRPCRKSCGKPFWSPLYGFGRLDAAAAVENALNDDRPDLMIRGAPGDDGTTPTPQDADSPDIWVRRQPDPPNALTSHQDPVAAGNDHWIYARVRNRGTVGSLEAWVRFSVAHPREGPFEYPKDWNPSNGTGNRSPRKWDEKTYWIGEVGLPRLAADGEFVVRLRWPAALVPPWDRCYLLVEITPHDGPLKGKEVHENNNLAQRAITVDRPPVTS